MVIADLDFSLITKRKRMMDAVGHYSRPDLLQLQLNTNPWASFPPPLDQPPEKNPNQPLITEDTSGLMQTLV